jgi:hypothetical protein
MRSTFCGLVTVLALAALTCARGEETPPAPPTWKELMAQGFAPYHQLTVTDFPVDDAAYPKNAFHIGTAVQPRYRFIFKPYNGFAFAYVDQWLVFSGLNRKETSRKSAFKEMKAALPYAQALLDINETNARRLAALKEGELPSGRGNTFEEAQLELRRKLQAFLDAKYRENNVEMEAFAKATGHGANQKKMRELAAEIAKRLKATPATTVPFRPAEF